MITAINPYYNPIFTGKNPNKIAKRLGKNKLSQKVLSSIREKNFIGMGNDSRAYVYNGNSEFVILVPKVFRPEKCKSLKFYPVKDFAGNINYGQPILASQSGIKIIKRVFGEEHSFHNWLNSIARFDKLKRIPLQEALSCLNGIKKISEFPIDSYIDLAKKVKYLNGTTKTVDCINPNNVLINHKKERFYIIDLWEHGRHGNTGVAGVDHMITLLLDGLLHSKLIKSLPDTQKEECIEVSKNIIYKCFDAARIIDLGRSKSEIKNIFKNCDKVFHHNLTKRYKEFNEIYGL